MVVMAERSLPRLVRSLSQSVVSLPTSLLSSSILAIALVMVFLAIGLCSAL
jgi:hypothetical protein